MPKKDARISPALKSLIGDFSAKVLKELPEYVDKIIEFDGDLNLLHDMCVGKVKTYTEKRAEVSKYISEYPPFNPEEERFVTSFFEICDKNIAQWQLLADNNHGKEYR